MYLVFLCLACSLRYYCYIISIWWLIWWEEPIDDPFFARPFDDHSASRKQITIEELNPDDDGGYDARQNNIPSKELSVKNSSEYPTGVQSFSFQRVAYGGLDGVYYTSSMGEELAVFLMEMKEEDRTVGESLHTISKGIHEKGHSVTTKQCSDGRVDSLQTLHNLNEDELPSFEETWKTSADKVFPGWNSGFNLLENAVKPNDEAEFYSTFRAISLFGLTFAALQVVEIRANNAWDDFGSWSGWGGWPLPSLEYLGYGGAQPEGETQGPSSREPSRKIVPVE
ncbi:UNVERIFIED_CONTAM: hypothetical protein Sradi_3268800 [Sesamum radiatum]|uniref:Uncharacterized protein n=1 Tax=Sesamum radiatum TaxID=300843 RepID=A0AAW2R0U3_SESRA